MPHSVAKLDEELARALADVRPLAEQLVPAGEGHPAMPASLVAPRAWSLGAAKAPIPAAPRPTVRTAAAHAESPIRVTRPPRRRWPLLAAAGLALLAMAVLAVVVVRWAHSTGATPLASNARPATALLTPVASPPAEDPAAEAPTGRYPGGTTTVYIAIRMDRPAGSPVLTFTVALQGDGAATATPLASRTFVVDASTPSVVPLSASSGVFAPGTYWITAEMNGTAVGSTSFVID